MKTRILILFCLVLSLASAVRIAAQSVVDSSLLQIDARAYDGKIVLRWAPANFTIWQKGNAVGYRLVRTTMEVAGKKLSSAEEEGSRVVLVNQLLPLPEMAWKPLADTNQLAIIAAGSLYSSTFSGSSGQVGSDVRVVNENDESSNRFTFGMLVADQFLDIATGMALAFTDETVVPGYIYRYRLELLGVEGVAVEKVQSANERRPLRAPADVSAKWRHRSVMLKWNRLATQSIYSSYFVERSADGGINFVRVNAIPLIYLEQEGNADPFMYYADTLSDENRDYQYRIRGRTPFGEDGPPSAAISGRSVALPVDIPASLYEMEEQADGAGIRFRWRVDDAVANRVRAFNVYETVEKGQTPVRLNTTALAENQREFLWRQVKHGHYYGIGLVDDTGAELISPFKLALLTDHEPPSPPKRLLGIMNEQGQATFSWKPNREEDLQGYRVYTSNNEDGIFQELTYLPIGDTLYTHTYSMNTLHRAEYFKVRAIDLRGNYSEFSAAARVVRPDLIPPAAPAWVGMSAHDKGVTLKWANSSSKDVVRHQMERRMGNNGNWVKLFTIPATPEPYNTFDDTTGIAGKLYEYRVVAIDAAGLSTPSEVHAIGKINTGVEGAITQLAGIVQSQRMVLSWQYEGHTTVEKFIIYRSIGDQLPTTYKVIPVGNPALQVLGNGHYSWEDGLLQLRGRYHYQIRALLKGSTSSLISEKITLEY
jgi:fibronectin type 3 domain-containing protein